MLFAIALVPILGLVGAAVDYSRANAARSAMQSALDTTALMVSRDAAANPSMSPDAVETLAKKYFAALYTNPDASGVTVSASFSAQTGNGSAVTISGTGVVHTDFMNIVNIPDINIGASSKTAWGNARMRVAMVLDNTGSMAQDGKMPALQTAAKNLIDQLSALAKTQGDVYISIIPFAKDVNVGASKYSQYWINWSGQSDTWDENNGSCSGGKTYKTKAACSSANAKYVWTPNQHSTWNGCVTDRDQNYDTLNTAPISGDKATPSTLFPAEQYNACPTPLMALSYDWTGLKAKVGAMKPNGGTNQAIGMAWGWQSLAMTDPLNAPAKNSNYTYRDAIILLSDGLNTQDRWPSYGNGNTQYTCAGGALCIDARQKQLCDNIKAIIDPKTNQPQYTIYTIQVNTGTPADPTSTVLQNCASSPDKFYMLTSANQIVAAFNSIGTSLTALHVAQ